MKKNRRIITILVLSVSVLSVSAFVEAQQVSVDHSSKFDEFYGSDWESAMARLDNFAINVQNTKSVGVVIVYGGKDGRRGEPRAWSACLNMYLVSRRGIEASRIVMVSGGYRKDLTVELWTTADKNHIPSPRPNVKPGSVRFKKGSVRHLCEI